MKTMLLIFGFSSTLLLNVSLAGEPFNDKSIDWIDAAPTGSYELNTTEDLSINKGFNDRGIYWIDASPVDSSALNEEVDPAISGFNSKNRFEDLRS
jgi:hypothetical protein